MPTLVNCDVSYRNLADMDGDGKMDRQEFSIAMKLIKMKLQGRSLPVALPMGLKQLPVAHAPHPSSARFGTKPTKQKTKTKKRSVTHVSMKWKIGGTFLERFQSISIEI